MKRNPILDGSLDIYASSELVNEAVLEAVDAVRGEVKLLAYRFGFLRLPFTKDRLTDGYNLHVWPEGVEGDAYPHTHIFRLQSRVMSGAVRNFIWEVLDDPNGNFLRSTPHYRQAQVTDVLDDRSVHVSKVSSLLVETGQVYEMDRNQYHTTKLFHNGSPVITLCKRYDIDSTIHPVNVVPKNFKPEDTFNLEPNQEEAWKIFDRAIDILR